MGVLASGEGTNLQALLDAAQGGELGAEVALVGCNRDGARAIARAAQSGVSVCLADRAVYPRRAERQGALFEGMRAANVDIVVLAGFDEIVLSRFVRMFEGRMINTHPALLPAFGGTMHAVESALEYGVKVTGCTVHLVTDDVDAGPIVLQSCVPVLDGDTVATLRARIQAAEHASLPQVVRAFAENRVRVEGNRVRMLASGQHVRRMD